VAKTWDLGTNSVLFKKMQQQKEGIVMNKAYVVLGNQLMRDHPAVDARAEDVVILIESYDICSKLNYHKHKLVLILSAMRNYRDYLLSKNIKVIYIEVTASNVFFDELQQIIIQSKVSQLEWMQTSDTSPQQKLLTLCKTLNIKHTVYPNQQFITSAANFDDWYSSQKSPIMESFYRWQRKRTGILMNDTKPEGGEWNYDAQNQKPLPKSGLKLPITIVQPHDTVTEEVITVVENLFPDNPGHAANFWLPTNFDAADKWLADFIKTKLALFGPYEDASRTNKPFLFHSVISPLLNCGLLDPMTVVDAVLVAYRNGNAPLNSVEGFVRQLIGWREYMYGMYRVMPNLIEANYFGFSKELESWWYDSTYKEKDLPIPVKAALETVHTYGYNHHIERLMVLGNWFLLNEYNPKSVYIWFSSMYVDAYEWVMVPNVQGMSQYADGGVIATKPYISGGNYLQKMGSWWHSLEEAKASEYNTLYWKFLNTHREHLKDNFRMGMILKLAEKYSK
jgi:deoxyribodipyrimidine photolyase-related protein